MYKVLFVCTGNICRSSTAQGVMTHLIKQEGLEDKIMASSSGMIDYHVGEAPDIRAIRTAQNKGYDISQQKAKQFVREDFFEYDLILAMAHTHEHNIFGMMPKQKEEKIATLERFMKYAPEFGVQDVEDPYYGTQKDFDMALKMIEVGCENLLSHIKGKEI
jgi:protein-tyrosine phosphatase